MYDSPIKLTKDFVEFGIEEIEQSIPERFEKQVSKYGDRIAIRTGDHEFTYDELNRQSNRIARAILERLGEGQEPVAIVLPQGFSMMSGAMGVLKSGKI